MLLAGDDPVNALRNMATGKRGSGNRVKPGSSWIRASDELDGVVKQAGSSSGPGLPVPVQAPKLVPRARSHTSDSKRAMDDVFPGTGDDSLFLDDGKEQQERKDERASSGRGAEIDSDDADGSGSSNDSGNDSDSDGLRETVKVLEHSHGIVQLLNDAAKGRRKQSHSQDGPDAPEDAMASGVDRLHDLQRTTGRHSVPRPPPQKGATATSQQHDSGRHAATDGAAELADATDRGSGDEATGDGIVHESSQLHEGEFLDEEEAI